MHDNTVPVITLDGPSGTGKGTLCQLLAKQLNWHMLDSGAIYRVLAYAARKNKVDFSAVDELKDLAHSLNVRFDSSPDHMPRTILEGEDVSWVIRSEPCGQDASEIAAIPEVRQALLERQRRFAQAPGLVTDGRDMGTVVFPKAILKVFLYANAQERANRRYLQLKEKGINVSLAQVVDELVKRDTRDMARAHAPLKPAADSVQMDTTGLSIDEVFNDLLELTRERLRSV